MEAKETKNLTANLGFSLACLMEAKETKNLRAKLGFSMACLINLSNTPLAKIPKTAFDGVFDQFT